MKFGGSSVADEAAMRQVATLVREHLPHAPLVVLSAMGKTTNALFSAAKDAGDGNIDAALETMATIAKHHMTTASALIGDAAISTEVFDALTSQIARVEVVLRGVALLKELTPRSLDAITGAGELLSTLLFDGFLRSQGVDSTWFDVRGVMVTDDHYGSAEPQSSAIKDQAGRKILPCLQASRVVVTQGYIGATADGLTTTLGRGGSDYSASLLGSALGANEVQIWTDVEGVLTCDPRVVSGAVPIPTLSFAEASELAAFGARVLHPATIQPAVEAGIPVTVRHTRRPDGHFTVITNQQPSGRAVTALAYRGNTTVVTATSTRMLHQSGFLARLFELFARHRISVDLIATAEVSVSITVDSDAKLDGLIGELSRFATVALSPGRAVIAVVGEQLKYTPGISAKVLTAIGPINVEMLSMGASELNLSLVIAESDVREALTCLHAELFERN